jgi:phosphoribosylformimino-5-aminoimidazole carboxamide ribotide isomerase
MLIPSIDLMGGKIVQLVQGEKKALEFTDFEPWVQRFSKYPLVQLIDLDAAMRKGSNRDLLSLFGSRLPCQVGGGISSIESARDVLATGARRVILGSSLIKDGQVNVGFAQTVAAELSPEKLVFAIDSRGGKVSIKGWKEDTTLTPRAMIEALEPYCSAFLYTHIDTEGLLKGFPLDIARDLRSATKRQLIVAGGIRSAEEVQQLDSMGADAVVGMAIYTGQMNA